ncbi:hypothetical protein GCM10008014_55330 [Paenibacillus silvae]|uniref:Uncharacterized protein n=1 Tax=Paenibacillus silvae TaxID=1325358 RepID=A0ABQ1ZP09_9BACL|nr:hypothetical protein GCM10008014_55330 [Paenibacillus silvae]
MPHIGPFSKLTIPGDLILPVWGGFGLKTTVYTKIAFVRIVRIQNVRKYAK